MDAMHGELYISCKWTVIVTVSVTTVLIGTLILVIREKPI